MFLVRFLHLVRDCLYYGLYLRYFHFRYGFFSPVDQRGDWRGNSDYIQFLGDFIGLSIVINPVTAVVTGLLGVPGVILLVILQAILDIW